MNCFCKHCDGDGTIECPECDGRGEWECGIAEAELNPSMHNFNELSELKRDVKRVTKQAERLIELNPSRKESYLAQLEGCLKIIDEQAEKAAKPE